MGKQRKNAESWLVGRESLSENVFLNDGFWKKKIEGSTCAGRYSSEWRKDLRPISSNLRPSSETNDEGWERYCFDFFEPFYLAGCLSKFSGGQRNRTFRSSGRQVDISFVFDSFPTGVWPQGEPETCVVTIECKNLSVFDRSAIENALRNLKDREDQRRQSIDMMHERASFIPVLMCPGPNRPNLSDISTPELLDISKRCKIITQSDLDYYRNQVRAVGWRMTWNLLLFEGLHRSSASGAIKPTLSVPALSYPLKGIRAITVVLSVRDALVLCHVPRANRNLSNKNLYQRPLKKSRLQKIAKTLLDSKRYETCFPNNIVGVLNLRDFANPGYECWWSGQAPNSDTPSLGALDIPLTYGLIKVIDGQHRLYSYLEAIFQNEENADLGNLFLTFTLLVNATSLCEKTIFASINTEAEEVNSNLVDVILYQMEEKLSGRGFAASTICRLCFEDRFRIQWFDKDYGFGPVSTADIDIDGDLRSRIKVHDFVRPFEMSGLTMDNGLGILQVITRQSDEAAASLFLEYIQKVREWLGTSVLWESHLKRRPGVRFLIYLLAAWLKKYSGKDQKLEQLAELVNRNKSELRKFFSSYEKTSVPEEDIKDLVQSLM